MAASPLLPSPLPTSAEVEGGGGGEGGGGPVEGGGGAGLPPGLADSTGKGKSHGDTVNSGKGAGEEGVSSSAPGVHKCQYCAKHYSSSHSLRTHEKWHRGDLGHPCSHCDKKFRNPSEVRRHEMTHTGEKPHKCPHCPTKFIQKVSIVSDVIIDKTNPCLKVLKFSPEQNIQKLLCKQ